MSLQHTGCCGAHVMHGVRVHRARRIRTHRTFQHSRQILSHRRKEARLYQCRRPGANPLWPGCVSSTLSSGGRANPVMIRAASSCEGLPWIQGCTHTGMRATTRWLVQRRIASSLRGARSETDDLARGARLLACHCCRSRHRLRQGGSDLSRSSLGAGCGKVSERTCLFS